MRMKAFQHVLTLDQAYFDNHSASAIRGSMNAHSINNLITWNIPYLITLNLQFFMTAIYMLRIGKLYLVYQIKLQIRTFTIFLINCNYLCSFISQKQSDWLKFVFSYLFIGSTLLNSYIFSNY